MNKKDFIFLLLIVCFSILINGYFFGTGNIHHGYIPIIEKYLNEDLYPRDYFVNTITPIFYTYMFVLLLPIVKIIGLEAAFFGGYFISLFMAYLGIFLLAEYLFEKKTAYLSVLLFLIEKPVLGAGIFSRTGLESSVMAFPFLIFAVYFFLKKRYVFSFVLVGLAFNIHAITSLLTFFVLILYFFIDYRKFGLVRVLKYFVVFCIFASPLLIWRFSSGSVPFLYFSGVNAVNLLKSVTGHHLFPSEWSIGKWLTFLAYVPLFLVALKYKPEKSKHKDVLTLIKSVVIVCILGYFFIEIVPVSVVLSIMPFRSTIFLMLFFIVYIGNYLVNIYEKGNNTSKVIATGAVAAIFISNFKAVLLFTVLLIAMRYRKQWLFSLPALVVVFLGFVLGIIATFYEIGYFFVFKLGYLSFLIILFSTAIIWVLLLLRLNKKRFNTLATLLVLFILLFTSFSVMSVRSVKEEGIDLPVRVIGFLEYMKPNPIGVWGIKGFINEPFKKINNNIYFPGYLPEDDWLDAQLWAKKNTESHSLFIAPPHLSDFRVHSKRSIIISFLDGGFSNYDLFVFGKNWIDRMADLCNGFECKSWGCIDYCREGYNSLKEEDFERIAEKYSVDYIVVEKPKQLNFEKVYENKGFVLYKI